MTFVVRPVKVSWEAGTSFLTFDPIRFELLSARSCSLQEEDGDKKEPFSPTAGVSNFFSFLPSFTLEKKCGKSEIWRWVRCKQTSSTAWQLSLSLLLWYFDFFVSVFYINNFKLIWTTNSDNQPTLAFLSTGSEVKCFEKDLFCPTMPAESPKHSNK